MENNPEPHSHKENQFISNHYETRNQTNMPKK